MEFGLLLRRLAHMAARDAGGLHRLGSAEPSEAQEWGDTAESLRPHDAAAALRMMQVQPRLP